VLVKCSLPYQNDQVTRVIRDLYFTGGTNSFANQFRDLFPIHRGDNGQLSREVPIPMVALIATVVSHSVVLFEPC
jgi:hypothetical protein